MSDDDVVVCGLVRWVSSVRISSRMWVPRRALDENFAAHTWQLNSLELEMGRFGAGVIGMG